MIYARWALYASALGVMGGFVAAWLNPAAYPRTVRIARAASAALLLSIGIILFAQDYAWFGIGGINRLNLWLIVSRTLWGWHWTWLLATAFGVAVVLGLTASRPRLWRWMAALALIATAMAVPLVGHGGGHDRATWAWHVAHVFGGGLWMGSLVVSLFSGLANRQVLLTSLRRFAPIAFTGAALVAVSGFILAWDHIATLDVLWTSDYGRTVLLKVSAVLVVGALGFVNWRSPRFRIVVAEVAVAVLVVLSLSAWLSELELPDE